MVDAIVNNKLKDVIDKIKAETPPPMNKMLNKQPLSEAIRKKNMRECMPIVDVQPTNPGNLFKINLPAHLLTRTCRGVCTPLHCYSKSTTVFIKDKVFIYFSCFYAILVPVVVVPNPSESTRNKPKCTACKQPMKGHKNVKDCPKKTKKK